MKPRRVYECPNCEGQDVEMFGYEDGMGEFGDDIQETWKCWACGYMGDVEEFVTEIEEPKRTYEDYE